MAEILPPFTPTPELDADIAAAAERVRAAEHVVALTGAGLSVESGIPPFRGPGGLWTKYGEPPMDGYQRFLADPEAAWRARLDPNREPWLRGLAEALGRAEPNDGHRALAALESEGWLACTITQNIDGLHGDAGSRALAEIHGNHRLLRCVGCTRRFAEGELALDPASLPPRCPDCNDVVKGDTVQFGEPIPPDVLRRCFDEVSRCDVMIVAGTSATVFPAADFPLEVLRGGGAVIEVNPLPSELSSLATWVLPGPGGEVLPRLLEHVRALGRGAREARA
ncbi:MAG TPA: Sir2 family NAD-dependent protein deacetylase [Myxococcota bacterium]|nr:Sir2 family NAD-dependent protein deacetylase [Myxococcota bacterium]